MKVNLHTPHLGVYLLLGCSNKADVNSDQTNADKQPVHNQLETTTEFMNPAFQVSEKRLVQIPWGCWFFRQKYAPNDEFLSRNNIHMVTPQ